MDKLFDFGISQEDPQTERFLLEASPGDRILSVASAGEVPLSLISTVDDLKVTAVDISVAQIQLCRLKLLTALHVEFPANACFLGYTTMDETARETVYREQIRPLLSKEEVTFWDDHLDLVRKGIVNAGRFEQYLKKIRFVANWFIGKKNLQHLIDSKSLEEQDKIFNERIATRKSIRLLFKIAFHPAVYKKRGLQEQALQHAGKTTGERFYGKFKDFCTSGPAAQNYFLQYFLTGGCIREEAYPGYLQPANRERLISNLNHLELSVTSFQDALTEKEAGYFNKIHLSNLGDWMSEEEFTTLWSLLKSRCSEETRMCYRYLQKNHIPKCSMDGLFIETEISEKAEHSDRFPFYGIIAIIKKKTQ